MQKLNFGDAKKQVEEILKIVDVCPEALKETCFKLLFNMAFADQPAHTPPPKPATPPTAGTPPTPSEQAPKPEPQTGFRLPPNVLAFTRRYQIPIETLQKLFILDHEPLLPIYNITSKVNRTAQLQKVLMILLENGLLNGKFSAPYAELRETIAEVG